MIFVLALLWLAALWRIRVTAKGSHTLWRWSFTVGVVLVAMGATAHTFSSEVARVLGPNTGSLTNHLLTILGGGAVSIFLVTLLHEEPPRRALAGVVAPAGVAAVLEYVAWRRAPLHTQDYLDIADASFDTAMLVYSLIYYSYLTLVLFTAMIITARAAGPAAADRSRTVGLFLVSFGTGTGGVALSCFLIRALIRYSGSDSVTLTTIGSYLEAPALLGIGLGTLAFHLGPRLEAWQWSRELERELKPLWTRLRELHPEVILPPVGRARTVRERSERMVIEIHDALTRVFIDGNADDVYLATAQAIMSGQPPAAAPARALDALPTPETRRQDELMLRRLAVGLEEVNCASDPRVTAA